MGGDGEWGKVEGGEERVEGGGGGHRPVSVVHSILFLTFPPPERVLVVCVCV